jgi:hypothetical protein
MEVVAVKTHEVAPLICCECSEVVNSTETFQVRDPREDYPQYICFDCINKGR